MPEVALSLTPLEQLEGIVLNQNYSFPLTDFIKHHSLVKYPKLETCLLCEQLWQPAASLSFKRRQEIMMGLRTALSTWLRETGRKVAHVAREADIDRRRLDWFLNSKLMTDGPGLDFYKRLYSVEVRFPGYFDPLVCRLLRVMCNYYVETR